MSRPSTTTRRFFLKLAAVLGARTALLGGPLPASAQDVAGKRVPPLEGWYYTYPEWIEFWRYTPADLKKIGLEVRANSGTRRDSSTTSCPLRASPTTVRSDSTASIWRRPWRTTGWSSAMRTFIAVSSRGW